VGAYVRRLFRVVLLGIGPSLLIGIFDVEPEPITHRLYAFILRAAAPLAGSGGRAFGGRLGLRSFPHVLARDIRAVSLLDAVGQSALIDLVRSAAIPGVRRLGGEEPRPRPGLGPDLASGGTAPFGRRRASFVQRRWGGRPFALGAL
jgi:hypothetical protein